MSKRYGEQDWHLISQGLQLLLEQQDVTIQRNQAIIESLKKELTKLRKDYDRLDAEYDDVLERLQKAEEDNTFKPVPVDPTEHSMTCSDFLDDNGIYSNDISAKDFSIQYAQKAYNKMRSDGPIYMNLPKHNGAALVPFEVLEVALKAYRMDVADNKRQEISPMFKEVK